MKDGVPDTHKQIINRILVLVPHAEIRSKIRGFSGELFGAGVWGAWAFPQVAPLALISREPGIAEMKECAALLRVQIRGKSDNTGRKGDTEALIGGACTLSAFPGLISENGSDAGMAVYGQFIDIGTNFLEPIKDLIQYRFSPIVLGAALTDTSNTSFDNPSGEAIRRVQPPEISFRAAALAVMAYATLRIDTSPTGSGSANIYSYSWKIGKLYWLPSQRAASR